MQVLKEHIKKKEFKPVYLLCGTEDYLKKLYRDKLKDGILDGGSEMNLSCFKEKGVDAAAVMEIAETLPFFAQRRLILIEDSGWFKNQSEFADYAKRIPPATHIVFVESQVDKRNRLYKAVKEVGTICEMNGMDEKNLKLWVASRLAADGKKVTEATVTQLLQKSGTDMENLTKEIEKLVCYAWDREAIGPEDVEAVCTQRVEGKVFQMIDCIAAGKQNEALALYYDLLSLRERPMTILYLMARHFNILLQIKELSQKGEKNSAMAGKVGIPPFTVGKYVRQAENLSGAVLKQALWSCTDTEEMVKTGRLEDQLGVELLIVEYSQGAQKPDRQFS